MGIDMEDLREKQKERFELAKKKILG